MGVYNSIRFPDKFPGSFFQLRSSTTSLATLINNIVCYYSLKGSILPRGGNLDSASSYLKTSGGNKKANFDVWRGVFFGCFFGQIFARMLPFWE